MKPMVKYSDWGLIDYREAWDKQTAISDQLKLAKKEGINLSQKSSACHQLVFCHHPHVYTLGKSGSVDHLLLSEEELTEKGAVFFKINRGGDITYHGPGQLVGYPIFDLEYFFRDVRRYVQNIEGCIIKMLSDYGIKAERQEGYTGVWIGGRNGEKHRKICAIGVHLSRWVSMHGFALNVNPDLSFFNNIIPCGIKEENKEVTSMSKELGSGVSMDEVKANLKEKFKEVFDYEYIP
ncbi:MAG: lipoyl(octanoyl) transferase LipB [Saprospirales bacterium]|nr:MAG: lipoyl(octanoyl) transferase LipB [Saprospirales bacterium]